MANPDGSGDWIDIRLLRPRAWIEQTGAWAGARITLSMPEMELEGPAEVMSLEACPAIAGGSGRVLTGTFTHLNGHVVEVTLKGASKALEPTEQHLFFSEDRQGWVKAKDLKAGERLRTADGQIATVESVVRKPGVYRVFNLEVEAEHQYYVGKHDVLVHNAYIEGAAEATPRAARRQAAREAGIPTSQQPIAQKSVRAPDGTPAGRQYTYETPRPGGGTQTHSVQHALTDNVPGHGPHWEAGPVKPGGQTDSLGLPRLTSRKVKVEECFMAKSELQVALRRNCQKRGWDRYLQRVVHACSLDAATAELLDATASLRFERDLFSKIRQGIADGSVSRLREVPNDEIEAAIENAYTSLLLSRVVIAPVNSMEFAFTLPRPPNPLQVRRLVVMDGDSVFVVSLDLDRGLGVDLYESERIPGSCFEVDVWGKAN